MTGLQPAVDVNHFAFMLARAQFGFTIAFHILLASFSIGLSSFLMVLEGLWLWTKKPIYIELFNFWLKILAINFAVGAVTGVVMEYQFGLNWGGLSARAGAVLGPLMMYEVVTAFFLEAGFLGIMLFGLKRVGQRLHFFATCMVALGSLVSAFWILSANSWMQTPAGYAITRTGRFVPKNWLHIIFNPSFPFRFVHMTSAAFLASALLIAAVGAWHVLHDRQNAHARLMMSMALWMIAVAAPFQIGSGDHQGDNTLTYQPQKVAAMEGDWRTPKPGSGERMVLFAVPSMIKRRDFYTIAIPHVASIYLRHDWDGTIKGLRKFPPNDIPYVPLIFYAFRIMVGLGFLIWGLGLASLWLRWRGRLYASHRFMWATVVMGPAGFIAMIAGWVVTEAGRQPYTIYGLLRTDQSNSPITLSGMITSLSLILLAYSVLYGIGMLSVLKLLSQPPRPAQAGPDEEVNRQTENKLPDFMRAREAE